MKKVREEIKAYIDSHPELKRGELLELHRRILKLKPSSKLWFLDGKNAEGKVVSNPNIGYGTHTLEYAGGKSREFYRIGLSANKTGLSVYILGLGDKAYLAKTYGKEIGKANVTGYCIQFRHLQDINMDILESAVRDGFAAGDAKKGEAKKDGKGGRPVGGR